MEPRAVLGADYIDLPTIWREQSGFLITFRQYSSQDRLKKQCSSVASLLTIDDIFQHVSPCISNTANVQIY